MESSHSSLSSLKEEVNPVYVQPHYKESYRLAIYALLCGGREAYDQFLKAEQISQFLSEEEILFILKNAELPVPCDDPEPKRGPKESSPSTYFPAQSDEEVPELDLGWPEVTGQTTDTSISLLFHPPRHDTPTIKEVIRRQIQDAEQVIAVVMDIFTDVDIFKEIVGAALRGVVVYILLDDSQFLSFLIMAERLRIRIQDFKNIRVRTVKGQQYRCRSGMRFHGCLEQRFILVDCKTVMYGTYSFMWSFEKIHLSMVLVITGELVHSYDEEFRRLFARSAVPDTLTRERASGLALRDTLSLHSPHSSQLSIHQVHTRSRLPHGLRSTKDDRTINGASLTRGQSMQERLHQSHHPDGGSLVRVHSYAGELQRFNSLARLRMVPRDGRVPGAHEKSGSNLWLADDQQPTGRAALFHHRHRSRYGTDQHLIPFNSETSLHRWKMDSYLSNDLPYNAWSPRTSQFSLNDSQSRLIPERLRDIQSKLEEIQLKRHSLQEYTDPRQSQEALKSAFSTLERCKEQSSLRNQEVRKAIAELEQNRGLQYGYTLEPARHGGRGTPRPRHEPVEDKENEGQPPLAPSVLSDRHRPSPHSDMKTALERTTLQTYDFHESHARTASAAEPDVKPREPSLMRPGGTQHSRPMESLLEIPEERDVAMRENSGAATKLAHNSDLIALKDEGETTGRGDKSPAMSNMSAGTENTYQARRHPVMGKVARNLEPTHLKRAETTAPREEATAQTVSSSALNAPVRTNYTVEASASAQRMLTQREESSPQRKTSVRTKVHPLLTSDEWRSTKTEEKSLQRMNSLRVQSPPGPNQLVQGDILAEQRTASEASPAGKPSPSTPLKDDLPGVYWSNHTISGPPRLQRHKSLPPVDRFSPQRSSKRKMDAIAELNHGSRTTLEGEGSAVAKHGVQKACNRFEHLLRTEKNPASKPVRTASSYTPHKDGGLVMNSERHASADATHSGSTCQLQPGGPENRLGRFIQRVGNLIGKNK